MKFLVAMDSFKESMNQIKLTDIVAEAINEVFPKANIVKSPLADGGEGTLDVLLSQLPGKRVELNTYDPLIKPIISYYGEFNDETIIIESAKAIGLDLVPSNARNPLKTSSFGVGGFILDALNKNPKKIIITLGGSSTNDAGVGMLMALGVKFYDDYNNEFFPKGESLQTIKKIDLSKMDHRIKSSKIIVWSDVDNPLTGPFGATYTFAKQKGASLKQIELLESGIKHFTEIVKRDFDLDFKDTPGAGAAGGLGYAIMSFLGGEIVSGTKKIFEMIKIKDKIKDCHIVFSGEGSIDDQTSMGKSLSGLANLAKANKTPLIAIAGSTSLNLEDLHNQGITSIFSVINRPMTLTEAMDETEILVKNKVREICKLILALKKER